MLVGFRRFGNSRNLEGIRFRRAYAKAVRGSGMRSWHSEVFAGLGVGYCRHRSRLNRGVDYGIRETIKGRDSRLVSNRK